MQPRQDIADHRDATVADVERAGRIDAGEFHLHLGTVAKIEGCLFARRQLAQALIIELRRKREIQKTRPGDLLTRENAVGILEVFENRFGDHARRLLCRLGPHHGDIGRQIAELALFRRLKKHRGEFGRIHRSLLRSFFDRSGQ